MTRILLMVLMLVPALGLAQPQHSVFVTGEELLAACEGGDREHCETYLQGVWDALVDISAPGYPTFCSRPLVVAENLAIVFVGWTGRNPDLLKHTAANLAVLAFSEAFPCPASMPAEQTDGPA